MESMMEDDKSEISCFFPQLFTCTVLRRLNCCIVGKSGRPMLCHSWYGLLTLLSMRYMTYTRPGEPTERSRGAG